MPVGANDFSKNWYSYNETEGDFEMKNFSIKNDFETLIPFIKNAQKIHEDKYNYSKVYYVNAKTKIHITTNNKIHNQIAGQDIYLMALNHMSIYVQ